MQQTKIPCFPISETTTWGEIPMVISTVVDVWADATGEGLRLLIVEPMEESRIPDYIPGLAPEELLVIAVDPVMRQAVFEALQRVELREPVPPHKQTVKTPKIEENSTFKSIYRQMAEMPATVFSLTMPCDDGEPETLFFLRTAFTISEFRREIEKPISCDN